MISWIDFLGYGASLAVLATFWMSTMITLRLVAIASNVLFCLYGCSTTSIRCCSCT